MEINVVFAHELVKSNVVWIQPPLLPFGRIAGGDAWVSDTGVELDWVLPPTLRCDTDQCLPRHLKGTSQRDAHAGSQYALQRTFPFMPYGSAPSKSGTGTPQVKSRVTGLGCNPPFSRGSTISPSALITELDDHFPAAYDRLIHSCVQSCSLSRVTYMCTEVFGTTL